MSTRKGGGYYGYKVHAAVDTLTGLPVAWTVETAKDAETTFALGLLDGALGRGFNVKNAITDKGYDNGPIHHKCNERGVCPITPLRQTPAVKRGDHKPRTCEHGEWTLLNRLQAAGNQVALPDRRMHAEVDVDQGGPPPPADPAPHEAVQRSLQEPWRR